MHAISKLGCHLAVEVWYGMVLVSLMCAMTLHGYEPFQGLLRLDRVQHAQDLHALSQYSLHDTQLQRQQAAHRDLPGKAHA